MSLRGIHLVSAVARRQKHSNVRLMCSPSFADVITDCCSKPVVHHWLVHREDSPEIIHWGQESTLDEAKSAALSFLRDLAERESSPAKPRQLVGSR